MLPVAEQTVCTAVTVTTQLPDLLLPSVDVAVIVTDPGIIPVTCPLLFTWAMFRSLVVQVSTWFDALTGSTVAGINTVEPTLTDELGGKVTELTSTG